MHIALITVTARAELHQTGGVKTLTLRLDGRVITAEVADTPALQQKGLMFRESLEKDHGMVFLFPKPERYCMWMKNTPLPLSVAFIDTTGRIVNIEVMQPMTEQSHCALRPVPFALEMEQGWFKKNGIGAGDLVEGLPRRKP